MTDDKALDVERVGTNGSVSDEVVGRATERVYDLDERTARFGKMVIDFAKKVPFGPLTNRLIDQLIGAGTSVGANYCEADDAVSTKDFKHRISYCKTEARESKSFIRMIVRAVPELRESAKPVWQEAKELHLIFAKIYLNR
ncbi:four helix bundle protein [Aeoliella sp.]|uniref:four helix bundle protein n=1 Tax=Aeoliella sp. TaxID=2795800 RepID=UPI003CCB81D3